MNEIISGIHQLQIPIPNNPLGHTNSYLVQGADGYLLIDTGWNTEEAFQSLEKQLAEIGIDVKDIRQIIVTHIHPDHYGLAGRLRELSQAKISLHYRDKELIGLRYQNMDEYLRQTEQWLHSNGVPANTLPTFMRRIMKPALPDITLRGEETVTVGAFRLKAIWTPGHSPGHICLYEPNHKILFSGDHVLPGITPNISLQAPSGLNPLGDFLDSLNKLKQLDANLVLPAHEHAFTGLATRVEEIIRHHQNRNSEILNSLEARPKTAYEVSAEITWMVDEGGTTFQNLQPWDKRMAVFEALAHLEAMRVDGRVNKLSQNSIIFYQPA